MKTTHRGRRRREFSGQDGPQYPRSRLSHIHYRTLAGIMLLMLVLALPPAASAQSDPELVGVSEYASTAIALTHVIPLPDGEPDDIVFLALRIHTILGPSWTISPSWTLTSGLGGTSINAAYGYPRMADSDITLTFGTIAQNLTAQAYRVRNANSVAYISPSIGYASDPPALYLPGITATAVWVAFHAAVQPSLNPRCVARPAGYDGFRNTQTGTGTEASAICSAWRAVAASNENPGAFSVQGSALTHHAYTVAFYNAPVAASDQNILLLLFALWLFLVIAGFIFEPLLLLFAGIVGIVLAVTMWAEWAEPMFPFLVAMISVIWFIGGAVMVGRGNET